MSEIGREARLFTRPLRNGVLSTLSRRLEGFPFGSVTPFVPDQAGRPLILISAIAEHTKNLLADDRVSLIVQPFSDDMQETARVTIVGRAEHLADKDRHGSRYLRYLPAAEAYFGMHDFAFYRIEPLRIRYIGGFGKIHWVEPAAYLADAGRLEDDESGILAHMNADHVAALRDYCRHVHGVEAEAAEMIGIDPDGFDVRVDGRILRFDFPSPIRSAEEARQALVELARQSRA